MIARTWLGRTDVEAGAAYLGYLEETGVRDCLETPGNRGVMVLRSMAGDEARFLFISFWDSMEVIRAFAGDDPERARYYDEDRAFLLDLPPTVDHFEVALHRSPGEGATG
jgi:heme-degrading monooxygenase HmoA